MPWSAYVHVHASPGPYSEGAAVVAREGVAGAGRVVDAPLPPGEPVAVGLGSYTGDALALRVGGYLDAGNRGGVVEVPVGQAPVPEL